MKNTDSLRNSKLEKVNPWDLLDNLVLSNVNKFKKILEGK